jgi:NADPH-dependent 7-cyano-7-deazaguanine reductase QueF-like protein
MQRAGYLCSRSPFDVNLTKKNKYTTHYITFSIFKMAKKNNRNYIGIEISPEYIEIINNRLNGHQKDL